MTELNKRQIEKLEKMTDDEIKEYFKQCKEDLKGQ